MSNSKVLLVGWDAADWKLIRPLIEAGEMPCLARLMQGGVHGNLATLYPALSPMLWTSIATGKRADKHGIHGFAEPFPDGNGVRPVTTLSRKTKAIWNILSQTGRRSLVVGWWPSHPAEPINGVMVSNHFQHVAGSAEQRRPLLPGTIHPRHLADALAELRVHPMELTGDFLRLFVPEYERVDQSRDKRLHSLGKIIAETMSVHAVATELLETQPWDFAAVYYSGLDHFGHGFMNYHPPRVPWVSEADFEIYHPVLANAYRYHDTMLGRLLGLVDENTTVIVMSDHGFHSDHLRPGYIPAEAAGPAVEHRHFGIVCMKGPGVRAGQRLIGASLLDICPTLLTVFGLPAGQDMDGKVLATAFERDLIPESIPTWDRVPGDAGQHPADKKLDPVASAEAFRQLVDLGYVEPPGADVKEAVESCVRELKYNLARAHLDAGQFRQAATLARALWDRWTEDHRFGLLLAEALGPLGDVAGRRRVVEELEQRLETVRLDARKQLAREQPKAASGPDARSTAGDAEKRRAQFERRRLAEQAMDRPLLVERLHLQQALLENNPAEARRRIGNIRAFDVVPTGLQERLAGALIQLGDLDEAREILQAVLGQDPENPHVHAQLARIHFLAGRMMEAVSAATDSLGLLYFQPAIHSLLGRALMAEKRFPEAEQALRVAVAQSARNLTAHDALSLLYRRHLDQPDKAFAHEGRAATLRNELAARQRTAQLPAAMEANEGQDTGVTTEPLPMAEQAVPPPFDPPISPASVITVVSGLPRSGTSLMMQLLTAAGRVALTDGQRQPDADNPLGYLEFEPATRLAHDASWLPQARGRVVKVVAQLLPFLPRNEHYQVVFMHRNPAEVVASQHAMLERRSPGRRDRDPETLTRTYAAQIRRVLHRLQHRPEVRLLVVDYASLLNDPPAGVDRLARFLCGPFDRDTALGAIHPELRRQRS